jgi:sucrose-phosphate synthase
MDAAIAQAASPGVDRVSIVTRAFDEPHLAAHHRHLHEVVTDRVTIDRIATGNNRYLEKEALAAELPAFTEAFCRHLGQLPVLPDVIHAHFADAAAVAIEARRRFGIPFVYTPHALAIDKRGQGLADDGLDGRIAAERAAIAAADALVVSTRDEAERQVGAYGVPVERRVHCIPPGVPRRVVDGALPTLVERLGDMLDRPDLPIILAIARPVAKKNLAALVRAYAADAPLQASANLVILAGQHDGRSSAEEHAVRATLHSLSDTPALRGRVALPPRHDAGDVAALYRKAAKGGVFVNPALHEPFGLTLIEAAEAGVPVVATRHGGPAEIVAAIGHGMLIDPRDDGAIAAACRAVIDDAAMHRRLRAAALANHGRYDWRRYAAQSVALYRNLRCRPALLACDIDNTLTGCAASALAFAQWRRDSGLPFVVATGRSFAAARAILAQWRLPEPDAFIVDVGTRIMVPGDHGGWRMCAAFAAILDRDWNLAAVADALAPLGIRAQPADTEGPHKLSFFGSADDAAAIRTALAAAGLSARVVFSHDRLIDVLAPSGGKAAAVAAYADRIGLTLAECVAAGDSGNDLDMLDACGFAIVVGNASGELDALAPRTGSYRAERHHAAGVLEGLERLGLTAPVSQVAA